MRDFTPQEAHAIERGLCPHCGGAEWYIGPRGGAAVNVMCPRCGTRCNVCPDMPGWGQMLAGPLRPIPGNDTPEV